MISTADFHLGNYKPRSRKDDYLKAQLDKFNYVINLIKNDDGLWLHSGDLFDMPEPSLFFVEKIIKILKESDIQPYCICGQHDLINRSLKDINKTGLGVLAAAGVINLIMNLEPKQIKDDVWLYGVPFGLKPIKPKTEGFNILLLHELIIEDQPEWFGQSSRNALRVLKENKYDLIISGDNHKYFTKEYNGRLLVNLGSIMRKKIDQADHKPRLFWTNFNDYDIIEIPCEKDVFDLSVKEEIDEDYSSSFVSLLDDDSEVELSFLNNLEVLLDKNNIDIKVKNKIVEYTS
jgi:DNA repair exonuclease SbcCD nuclease subunit